MPKVQAADIRQLSRLIVCCCQFQNESKTHLALPRLNAGIHKIIGRKEDKHTIWNYPCNIYWRKRIRIRIRQRKIPWKPAFALPDLHRINGGSASASPPVLKKLPQTYRLYFQAQACILVNLDYDMMSSKASHKAQWKGHRPRFGLAQ